MKSLMANEEIPELDILADGIRQQHDLVRTSVTDAFAHAIEAGRLLIRAKEVISHGRWLPWLAANCRFAARTAQTYMRLAEQAPVLLGANAPHVADLTVRRAVALLKKPKPEAVNQCPDDLDRRGRGIVNNNQDAERWVQRSLNIGTQAGVLLAELDKLAVEADEAGKSTPELRAYLANVLRRVGERFVAKAETFQSIPIGSDGIDGMPCENCDGMPCED
jgi:Protein of unknown function (DUF3102)